MTPNLSKLSIEEETALIAKLEASGPFLDTSVGMYHKNNTAYHIHATEISDAYWRRRNKIAKDMEQRFNHLTST